MGEAAKAEKKRSRFQEIKAEFKKIVWPSKDTIVKHTVAVTFSAVVLAVIIAILDTIIKMGLGLFV